MERLHAQAAAWGIDLNPQQMAQFAAYRALLLDWNLRFNLTRIVDPAEVVVRHFLDSLSVVLVTGDLGATRAVDVGTGAGFPGLPLKIAFPGLQITLIDSVAKKLDFVQYLTAELGLTDVNVAAGRVEMFGRLPAYREQYDWALARAVAPLPVLAEYLLPLVRVGGGMCAHKGADAAAEAAATVGVLAQLGADAPRLQEVGLPGRADPFWLVGARKIAPTPAAYPRRPGIPVKRPLSAG